MKREFLWPLLILAGSAASLWTGVRVKGRREARYERKNIIVGVTGLIIGLIYLAALLA